MRNREILRASFNTLEDVERDLYDYALSKGNVSKYLKRLILLDKEGKKVFSFDTGDVEKDDDDEDVSSFI